MKPTTTLLCTMLALTPMAGLAQSATAPPPAAPPPPAATAPAASAPPASAGPQTPGAVKPLPPPRSPVAPRGANGQRLPTPPPARPLGNAPTTTSPPDQATTMPTVVPFSSLDRTNTGSLRQDQAGRDPWLSAHFAQCDSDHNQQVSQSEYQACSTRK